MTNEEQRLRYKKLENIAIKLIKMAEEEEITVEDFSTVLDISREIAKNSVINTENIKKFEFPSRHF